MFVCMYRTHLVKFYGISHGHRQGAPDQKPARAAERFDWPTRHKKFPVRNLLWAREIWA